MGIKDHKPHASIKKFREQSRDRFIQADELPHFWKALAEEQNETIRDYIIISLLTGARKSNVLSMRWDQINFERGEWRIPITKNNDPLVIPLLPKHNSRRVDHPCQLPPLLMRRLYSLYTQPNEIIVDCFNGAGTSTLVAAQMKRRYIGIELSPEYHKIAQQRHKMVEQGQDPFAKNNDIPKVKNSRVERLAKIKYVVSKKTLQLDIRRMALLLGHTTLQRRSKTIKSIPI